MQLHSAVLRGWVQPADVFVQFFANETNAFWLDRETNPEQPFSVLGAGNLFAGGNFSLDSDIPGSISPSGQADLPFTWRPGLVGFVSYEGEAKFLEVDRAIVFDHRNQSLYFVGMFDSSIDFDFWHHGALLRLGLSGGQLANYLLRSGQIGAATSSQIRHGSEEYLNKIREAQEHIAIGDIYQICLTNEIEVVTDADPLLVFLNLRAANPAPYAAFMKIDGKTIVSASPEQFIRVSSSGTISTKPIKGTRPRGLNPEEDAEIAAELRANEKERAENLMIVDLMRNDIGKVSKTGSVSVPLLFEIESYATVHQLVSTVVGQLAEGETAWSALQAAFPGGSMTGAPKIRAMEILIDLEKGQRGAYSGCLGYFGNDGSAELGMTIRTVVFEDGVAKLGVGGGITIDSNPDAELAETRLKARALLEALNAPDPWLPW